MNKEEYNNLRKELKPIVIELLHGLISNGESQKQYHLEQALRKLCDDEWVDSAKKEFKWENGDKND